MNTFINHPERFDLVITDQAMPELTGVDLARNMLEVRKDLPIVLITGYSEAVSPEKAKSAGISEFVMKPLVKRAGRDGAADAGQQGRRFCRIEVEYLPPRELSLISLKVSDDRSHVLGAY